jgi:hypothetical protein
VWQTPLARDLMHTYFGVAPGQVPEVGARMAARTVALGRAGREPRRSPSQATSKQLVFSLQSAPATTTG